MEGLERSWQSREVQGHMLADSKDVRGRGCSGAPVSGPAPEAVLGFGNPALKHWGVTPAELV